MKQKPSAKDVEAAGGIRFHCGIPSFRFWDIRAFCECRTWDASLLRLAFLHFNSSFGPRFVSDADASIWRARHA